MGKKRIYAIGLELPDQEGFEVFETKSELSLLDADIVLFRPTLEDFHPESHYQGRPLLSQHESFQVGEKISHWTMQLKTAVESKKTVVILLPEKKEVYRYTGEVRTSGTGRSQQRTNIVGPVHNYQLIPWRLDDLVCGTGQGMRLAAKAEIIASYWKAFGDLSVYHVHFSTQATPLVVTKSAGKAVGLAAKNLILLPDLKWDSSAFVNKAGTEWSKAAHSFALGLRNELLGIDAAVHSGSQTTPEPSWSQASEYRLSVEDAIEKKISHLTARIEATLKQREEHRQELMKSSAMRALLYEKGPALESAVREALSTLGFRADAFKNGDSEFDAVFESNEGRFLGEVEGRDSKPIAVEKYSQLESNINEDLQQKKKTSPAKAVLFGNAFRLTPIAERDEFFTDKVKSAARRTGAALVRTPDLFVVARYVKESGDVAFAADCRKCIAETSGELVIFPAPPTVTTSTQEAAA